MTNQKANTKEWDNHLQKSLELWGVPGLAVVALKNNEVVYSKGFGHRDVASKLAMTKDTIHPIGSCTKSFTSTAIAMLVDEGKLEWDTPVHEFIPRFRLKDSVASSRVTIVDMLSHRTGLPSYDLVWLDDEFTYDQTLDRLPYLDLSTDIRTKFQYCNLMYLAASVIIEELSGMSYNDFIAKRIFRPLRMRNSNFSVNDMQRSSDYAKPYKIDLHQEGSTPSECEFVVNDSASGAGCINASISDMGKWLAFHLNNGRTGKRQLVSPENLRKTHDPVIIESVEGRFSLYVPGQKLFRMQTYALGWMGSMYRGRRLVIHSGGIDGSTSLMMFLPDENVGVMAVVNQTFSLMPPAISYHMIDDLLELDSIDLNAMLKPIDDQQKKAFRQTGEQSQELRKAATSPTHPLLEYVGKYHHPGYGKFEFYIENDMLGLKYGTKRYPLSHYHYDTFQFEMARFDFKDLLTFQTDSTGEIVGFTIKIEEALPPIPFTRLPDEHLKDKNFLKTLIGKYDVAGEILDITLKGDDAIMAVPSGQPAIELEPVRGMRFKSKGSDLFSVTFKKDQSGQITEFTYVATGLVIPAKRIV